ncbi:MAG: hydratase [Treponema sp.]|jgi:aconitate hydratase|nr:hydratase [Treponema sp.]
MVRIVKNGVLLVDRREFIEDVPENRGRLKKAAEDARLTGPDPADVAAAGRRGTMTYRILAAHHGGAPLTGKTGEALALRFDAMASHDITFVNIIQTARVSGLERFPLPYILTNCHNSLCAVGGTINEDDHLFGLSAAKKYGGIYVPPHLAVIHSYLRETQAGCGKMILGSDSHTRYGALGTMGVGEGGGELVKQLLEQPYGIPYPRVIAVALRGKPGPGVGPQDAALAVIGAVFKDGFVKNAVLEFVGEGIGALPMDFRTGIDVMTTETTCWSSIWETDDRVRDFLTIHGRGGEYTRLSPEKTAWYDGLVELDLSSVKPMIALPFHPGNVYEIETLNANAGDILASVEKDAAELMGNSGVALRLREKIEGGGIRVDQGIIAGCAGGTFDNIMAAAAILRGGNGVPCGPGFDAGPGLRGGAFSLSVYPGSQPVMLELLKNGAAADLVAAGAVLRTAFCGPCFGAGDVPANNGLSVRHATRNFPNREGSKPVNGQIAAVALMDARSIAATCAAGGLLRAADAPDPEARYPYHYDDSPYRLRVYQGAGKPDGRAELILGPNITDWPPMAALGDRLLVKIVSFITDPVTTTDELIPSGETSSFRSNPLGLAEFTLSRKDPGYVAAAKAVRDAAASLRASAGRRGPAGPARAIALADGGGAASAVPADVGGTAALAAPEARTTAQAAVPEAQTAALAELEGVLETVRGVAGFEGLELGDLEIGSAIFARKPGDGSAREQAASCQRVLGGLANFANEYATKRYRSNLVNWGIVPFVVEGEPSFKKGDYVFIPRTEGLVSGAGGGVEAWVISRGATSALTLTAPELNDAERDIIRAGSLINYNRRLLKRRGE